MKLKVCGNRDNIQEVASLNPDYMGFIYWEPSSRAIDPEKGFNELLPASIKKIGVFVDAEPEFIQAIAIRHGLDYIQLHGKESVEYLQNLKKKTTNTRESFLAYSVARAIKTYRQIRKHNVPF